MEFIHHTAVIDEGVSLAPDVRVGPYAVISGPVRIGPGCFVSSHAVIIGPVIIGVRNKIGSGAVIGGYPQDLSFNPDVESSVEIGDDNVIREHCTIHRGTKAASKTVLGSNCYLMAGAHLGHNTQVGNHAILANNVLLGGYVEVGDGAFLGGGAVVHQHTRIGQLAMMQGMAGVGRDIPPFTTAAGVNSVVGLNIVGLRRNGYDLAARSEVKRGFDLLYRSGLKPSEAARQAECESWSPSLLAFWKFVRASKRGICPFRSWRAIKDETVSGSAEGWNCRSRLNQAN
jgi:UDP-N-acetylglucosamine acyltransferase